MLRNSEEKKGRARLFKDALQGISASKLDSVKENQTIIGKLSEKKLESKATKSPSSSGYFSYSSNSSLDEDDKALTSRKNDHMKKSFGDRCPAQNFTKSRTRYVLNSRNSNDKILNNCRGVLSSPLERDVCFENKSTYKFDSNCIKSPYANIDFFSVKKESQREKYANQRTSVNMSRNSNKKIQDRLLVLNTPPSILTINEGSYIDAHCHIDFMLDKANFRGSFAEFMAENPVKFPENFDGCIAIFCNPFTFKKGHMWSKHLTGDKVWASFGCHPKRTTHYDLMIEKDLIKALSHPKVCALGEIGLDYSDRSKCSPNKQKAVFIAQIKIALKMDLPLVIHCREAYADCLNVMKEHIPCDYPIHLHCFTEKWSIAKEFLEKFPNLCIGITNLISFSSAKEVHEVATRIPLDRLLLETDAPYFVPDVLSKKAKYAHPGMAIYVAARVATLKNIKIREVVAQTRRNTKKIYRI